MVDNIYSKIENPLDKSRFVEELLYNYLYKNEINNPYNYIVQNSKRYSVVFYDVLFKTLFNDWKNNLCTDKVDSKDYYELKRLLSNINVKNAKDFFEVINTKNGELRNLISNYSPLSIDDNDYYVINSKYMDDKPNMKIEHSLCINCDISKIHQFVYKFIEKCKDNNLSYNLKFNVNGDRKDSIIIYSDTKSLSRYISFIEVIIKEGNLDSYIGEIPLLMGTINEKIGYSSESSIMDSSFISKREKHLVFCIYKEAEKWIKNNINNEIITSSGRFVSYRQMLFTSIISKKKKQLLANMRGNSFDKRKYGYTVKDIDSISFDNYIIDYLVDNLDRILDCIIKNKKDFVIVIPYKRGEVSFSYYDFKDLIDRQIEDICKDKEYRENVLRLIKKTSLDYGIDSDNYAVDDNVSFALGKESVPVKSNISLEILNNFDDNQFFVKRNDNKGRILDSNIKKESIISKLFKRKK